MFHKAMHTSFVARWLTLSASFATFFGALWVYNGISSLQASTLVSLPLTAVTIAVGLIMALAFIRLSTTASLFPPQGDPRLIKRAERYINYAIAGQFIVSVAGPMLLTYLGHANLGFPLVILSVGLYLLTVAPLLRVTHYYIIGALLCLIPVLTFLFVPVHLLGAMTNSQVVIAGIGSGITFLVLGSINMILAVRMRRGQYKGEFRGRYMKGNAHHITGLLVA